MEDCYYYIISYIALLWVFTLELPRNLFPKYFTHNYTKFVRYLDPFHQPPKI